MVFVWMLAGCTDLGPVEARQDELESDLDALAIENQELRQRVLGLAMEVEALRNPPEPPGPSKPTGAGPWCTRDGDTFLLPPTFFEPGDFSRLGRALLHRGENGEFDGYRISAIRAGGTIDSCGFENGDIVHEVNGKRLGSIEDAMEAYAAVETAERLEFELTRRGRSRTLTLVRSGASPATGIPSRGPG